MRPRQDPGPNGGQGSRKAIGATPQSDMRRSDSNFSTTGSGSCQLPEAVVGEEGSTTGSRSCWPGSGVFSTTASGSVLKTCHTCRAGLAGRAKPKAARRTGSSRHAGLASREQLSLQLQLQCPDTHDRRISAGGRNPQGGPAAGRYGGKAGRPRGGETVLGPRGEKRVGFLADRKIHQHFAQIGAV